MRVAGARYVPGDFPVDTEADAAEPMPAGDADAGIEGPPSVDIIESPNNTVRVGVAQKSVRAFVSPHARTVAFGLEGDDGYWLVPVGVPSAENAPDLEVNASLDFDRKTPLGKKKLWLAAADEHGEYGSPRALDLNLVNAVPKGELVVALDWTGDMDLDLVIVNPDGSVLTSEGLKKADGTPIPRPSDPTKNTQPSIDVDSNQGCRIDGLRNENAIYDKWLPAGTYRVYVRLAQTCGMPQSNWKVRVLRKGKQVGAARGASYAWQVDTPHGGPDGPGVFAAEFHVGN